MDLNWGEMRRSESDRDSTDLSLGPFSSIQSQPSLSPATALFCRVPRVVKVAGDYDRKLDVDVE